MAPRSRKSGSQLSTAIVNLIEPIQAAMDENFPAEMGHEAPSRQDKGLQILVSNLCRDVYQQIHGVPSTATFAGFPGCKDSIDRVESQISRVYQVARENGDEDMVRETMETNPQLLKMLDYHRVQTARYEGLSQMLDELKDAYHTCFGIEWVYAKPGSAKQKVSGADAVSAIRGILSKKADPVISENSTLIKANGAQATA